MANSHPNDSEATTRGHNSSFTFRGLRSQLEEVRLAILQQKLEQKKCLEAFETRQRGLEAKQRELEKKQRELEKKQRELETELSLIVYPVLTLPPEIVARFFVACLEVPDDGDVHPCQDTAPLLLTQICRAWREIAASTCKLWAYLEIAFPSNLTTDNLRLVEMWFAMAKKTPLSITLGSGQSEFRTPVLSLLSAAAGQIHSLQLNLSREDCQFLQRDRLAFPNLKCLAVSTSGNGDVHDPLIVFHNALSLTELSISRDPGSVFNLYPLLTSLALCKVSFRTVSDALRACPRLLHLDIFNDTRGWASSDQAPPAPLLSSFILDGPDLSHFTLPNLRRLQFERDFPRSLQSFPAFISRSSCVLEHLALEITGNVAIEVAAALRAVPSLKSLALDFWYGTGFFFELMDEEPSLLPNLTSLSISAASMDIDYLGLARFLRARMIPLGRLASVEVIVDHDPDQFDLPSWGTVKVPPTAAKCRQVPPAGGTPCHIAAMSHDSSRLS
ncbi:hypothetical protein DFH06DRAFT_1148097 [Mycena polygramma]|nr:hypothetical protein DFH06DRAFT_1148097 [Mycena polygramma]